MYKFSARPDSLDFRDRMFQPGLAEVPVRIDLDKYKQLKIPVLNQRRTWACTGFALATVVHYMLRRREVNPDWTVVSPAMLFEMARRYDEYPSDQYLGSSARGAMKGWYYHGVCSAGLWPYRGGRTDERLTAERAADAARRPLGVYLRVNHRDLVAMHCALAEVGVLYAVANVHDGWLKPRHDGVIARRKNDTLGGHAIAIVAYDQHGFWIQNSWGKSWGAGGFGFLPYDDWLENGLDVWVGRLGVPVVLSNPDSVAAMAAGAPVVSRASAVRELRPHLVRVHSDGYLRSDDRYGTSKADLVTMFEEDFPRITSNWKKKRILLYAGSGLSATDAAVQHAVADHRAALLDAEIYPIAFIWRTSFWKTISDVLRDALGRIRDEPAVGADSDFMLDRMDHALEPLVREYAGKLHWDQMKHTALEATNLDDGAARLTLDRLVGLMKRDPSIEINLVGYSAGAILLAPVVQLLTASDRVTSGPMKGRRGFGQHIESCVLWAPACTSDLFHQTYYRAMQLRRIRRFMLFTLTDKAEQADGCAGLYRKSLLYLVSNALEEQPRVPSEPDGTAIVGMEKFVRQYPELLALFRRRSGSARWVLAPNTAGGRSGGQSTARHHGDFDDDAETLYSTFCFILGKRRLGEFKIRQSASSVREWRRRL
jgi:hypothetical protein